MSHPKDSQSERCDDYVTQVMVKKVAECTFEPQTNHTATKHLLHQILMRDDDDDDDLRDGYGM
eukprot:6892020-Pyramimonas_sp.AAC.1